MSGQLTTTAAEAIALMPDAALAFDLDGVVRAANDAARAIFGGEPVGVPGERLLPVGELLARDAPQRVQLEGRRANGVPFPLEATLRRVPGHVLCAIRELNHDRLVGEAQRYFDVAFDAAPIGMALFNSDGEYLRVNAALCAMLGRTPEELLGRRDQELTHPDDRQADVDAAWRILAGELHTWQCEKRFVRPDGAVVWALANLTFLRDEGGRPLSWVGQFQDITARRAAEESLRASEERHRLVVQNLPGAGVVLYDRDLRCTLIEGRHMEEPGISEARMVGRPMHDVLPSEMLAVIEPLARAALAGEPGRVELRSGLTGRLLDAEVVPHRDGGGDVGGALVVVRDVTEQRAAERATRDARRRFEVAFERAPIGMVIVGLDGRLERSNAALCRMTGYSAEQLAALDPFGLVEPEHVAAVRARFGAFAAGADTLAFEHRCRHASGDSIWLRMEAALIRDDEGVPVHVLAQVQDVTDRRRHEARLRHLADHDGLTGLLNRRAFRAALERHLLEPGAAGAVLMIDLDGFKGVNDRLGHRAGDELIAACAAALRRRVRSTDVLARLGGDEFALLVPNGCAAETVARSVVEVIRGATAAAVTASVGVAAIDGRSAEEVLVHADRAMYAAKRAGRDGYSVHPAARAEPLTA